MQEDTSGRAGSAPTRPASFRRDAMRRRRGEGHTSRWRHRACRNPDDGRNLHPGIGHRFEEEKRAMSIRWNVASMAAVLMVAGTGHAPAQDGTPKKPVAPNSGAEGVVPSEAMQGRVFRLTKLVACNVKNTKEERIGEIKDVVLDEDENCVAYAVLSFGGFLGLGEKLFVVPFSSLKRGSDESIVTLDVTKEQLENAPSFTESTWPTFDRKYATTVNEYYKATPYLTTSGHSDAPRGTEPARAGKDALEKEHLRARGMCRASKQFGVDVVDGSGKSVGDVDDIVVDDATGRIAYGVLSFGGFLGAGDKLFAIPWRALKPSAKEEGKLVLDVPKEKLEKAPGFDKKSWPDMADHRWGLDIYRYYGEKPYWDSATDPSTGKPVGAR
jgi:sporulation protein YlmC with PRC-barrel domain